MIVRGIAWLPGRRVLLGGLALLLAFATAALPACGGDGDDSGAGGELTAEDILEQSAKNAAELESFHLALDVSIDLAGMESETTLEGDFEPPDDSYIAIQIGSDTTETLTLGSDIWERTSPQGPWREIPAEAATVAPDDYIELAQGLGSDRLSEAAGDITLLADEIIDGQEAYHMASTLDVAGALSVFQGLGLFPGAGLIDPASIEGEMEVESWVSKEELLPLRLLVAGDLSVAGADIGVIANIELSAANEPVTFPSPD